MTVYDFELGLSNFLEGGQFLELVLENICKYHLREGELAIDGGANRGRHTISMARCVGNSGSVIAIEAIPELAEALRSKIESLPVNVVPKALAAKDGQVEFAYCTDRDTRSGIHARKFIETMNTQFIKVEAVKLSSLIEKGSQVSLIKLDLEGGEHDALRGAEEILRRDRPLVVAEHGGYEGARLYGYSNREYYQYLCDLGYTVFNLLGRPITSQRFENPDVWYFAALDLQNDRHTSLLKIFPALLIAAAQQVMSDQNRRFVAS